MTAYATNDVSTDGSHPVTQVPTTGSFVRRFSLTLTLLLLFGGFAGCRRELPVDVSMDATVVEKLQDIFRGDASTGEDSASQTIAEPTGFADFTGVFRLDGTAPTMTPVNATGNEVSVCFPDGRLPLNPEVIVGPNNELSHVLVYVDMALPAEWEHESFVETREALLAGSDGFDQIGCMFVSRIFPMRSTQRVELLNSDKTGHNTNIAATGRAKTYNAIIPSLSKSEYAPGGESRGPFAVTCNIHPWMRAYMIIRDNPYFAVTDDEGRFEMKNLPAGVPLTFRVWQERAQTTLMT
jgi:hypothetical protein